MRKSFVLSLFLIVAATACVDRLASDIGSGNNLGIVVDGFISDEPGPYEIKLTSFFDIQSKESTKTPISVKSLVISDAKGKSEQLTEVAEGIYQTSVNGLRGELHGIYKLRIETFDGRVYESLPDTLTGTGNLKDLRYEYVEKYSESGEKEYFLNVVFDGDDDDKKDERFVWKFISTFQATTQPELYPSDKNCFWLPEIGTCNYVPPCSGMRNVGTVRVPKFERKYDCTCCTCWYNIFNSIPILSDPQLFVNGKMKGVQAGTIPLNQWTLFKKIRIAVSQMSLSRNAYRFWRSIKDQKKANGNLFQPITGKIPSNFVQLSGREAPIGGLFFATHSSTIEKYVTRFDLPPSLYAIPLDTPLYKNECQLLFENSSNLKPPFWKD